MKNILLPSIIISVCIFSVQCNTKNLDFAQFPSAVISNDEVEMKIYLPDPEKGLYRATRFDWSGVIGSVQYKDHEYFGYWKDTHDPLYHEDLTGPVEGFINPGLGYAEAEPGGTFIRIGVGVLEKPDETTYNWTGTYKIMDHGTWDIDKGNDWVSFTHEIKSDIGYSYIYKKIITLKSNGFIIKHELQNTGIKTIETDQFNHNFFMIDNEPSGPSFKVSFPYTISTKDDLKGYLEINENDLNFIQEFDSNSVFLELSGYSDDIADHQVTVVNQNSGAGVTFNVDKPLSRMAFWACETTLCPENFIEISVEPKDQDTWTSDYTLFVK